MPRILVTGAGGFLGRYAVEALRSAGWTVTGTGREAPSVDGLHESLAADLLDSRSTQKLVEQANADVLLHLAWFNDPATRWHANGNLSWAASTLNLVQKFASVGGTRVVFGSSCAVYDFAARSVHNETDALGPNSLYGHAKASTAALISAAQKSLGISVVEARIFFCYGAGEQTPRLVPDLIDGLSHGEAVACTDGIQKRDYLHASDVGNALRLITDSDITGPVNVASGLSIPVAELIREVAEQLGCPELPKLGAIERPDSDPSDITADISRLKRLGFRPQHTLTSGVAETLSANGFETSR